MPELRIQLRSQDGACEPGAVLDVPIEWRFEEQQSALELRIVWNTSGKATENLRVAERTVIDHPPLQGSQTVSVQLPLAPYSFSATLVSIIWAVELVAVPSQVSTRQEIVIAPQGREVSMLHLAAELDAGDE